MNKYYDLKKIPCNKLNLRITQAFFLMLISVAGISQQVESAMHHKIVYPDSAWESLKNPSAYGWNTQKLKDLQLYIIDSTPVTGVAVIHGGRLAFTYGDIKETSYVASVRKSILAMLYGPYVENGTINLKTTLEELKIDDIHGLLPIEKKATIGDLISARSGIYHPASNEGDERSIAPSRGTVVPGTLFVYNNYDFNLASHLLQKLTGRDIYHLLDSMLVRPLNMEDWNKNEQTSYNISDTTRSIYPPYHMWFSTRDMARIGYLMLRQGKWKDQQILSSQWVNTITSPITTFSEAAAYRGEGYEKFGYGYMWWVWDGPANTGAYKNAYAGRGAFGQYIIVLPAIDVVLAIKTNDKYGRNSHLQYLQLLDKLVVAYQHNTKIENANPPFNVNTDVLHQYTGEYLWLPQNRKIVITHSENLLQLSLDGNTPTVLNNLTDSSFYHPDYRATLTFKELKNGKAQQLAIQLNDGQGFIAMRNAIIENHKIPLKQFEGKYVNQELSSQLIAKVIDGKLQLMNPLINYSIELIRKSELEFISGGQTFRFTLSSKNQKIPGIVLETKSLPDKHYLKK